MKCVTDYFMWYDWTSVVVLYVLGMWKTIELLNKLGKKIEEYMKNCGNL